MSAAQISTLHYGGSYGYKRIKNLEEAGYLCSKAFTIGRRKVTQYYYLTQKSLGCIGKDAENIELLKIRSKILVERHLMINEFVIRLNLIEQENGSDIWNWIGSREAKKLFNLYARDNIAGLLENKDTGQCFGVYFLMIPKCVDNEEVNKKVINEQGHIKTVKASKKSPKEIYSTMFGEIEKEIDRNFKIDRNIIICETEEGLNVIRRHYGGLKSQSRNIRDAFHNPPGKSMLTIGLNKAAQVLYNLQVSKEKLKNSFDTILKIKGYNIEICEAVEVFADFESEGYFIKDLFLIDLVALRHLKEYLSKNRIQKQVLILCNESDKEFLLKNFVFLRCNEVTLIFITAEEYESIFGSNSKIAFPETISKIKCNSPMTFSLTNAAREKILSLPDGMRSSAVSRLIEEFLDRSN
jgi:hypothetical protein